MITVAIVDDNRLVRDALAAMLGRLADVSVVAVVAADSSLLDDKQPNVLLLDAGLNDADSLSVAATIAKRMPTSRVIVMDLMAVNEDILQFVNAGVAGFVLKDATFDEFVATIRSVAAGDKVLPLRMTETLFAQIMNGADVPARKRLLEDVRMTKRELEVIELIGEGLSNKEIAQRLNIAAHTVKSHVRNVMEKLALHTRLQIAAFARREGGT